MTAPDRSTTDSPRAGRPIIRRRQIIVDPGFQYRAAAVVTVLVGLLFVFLNIALMAMRQGQTELLSSTSPELRDMLAAGDLRMAIFAAAASVAVLTFVFFATVLATHRTAGAIVGVRRRIEAVRDGDLFAVLKLRANDNLRSLEVPFNQMMDVLRRRVREDAEALDELAAKLESGTSPESAAEAIREQARALRARVERVEHATS